MSKQLKQVGTVLFSNIVNQPVWNGQASGKYELTLTLSPEEAADAETNGAGLKRKEYQGQEQCNIQFKTKFPMNDNNCVDRYKKPFVDDMQSIREIPRGSKVAVYYSTKPYEMMGKAGISNYLLAVQVIEENSAIEFESYDEPDALSEESFDGEF